MHQRFGLDLWMVTHVDDERQVVVASTGPWHELAPPGGAFSWAGSFCIRMVQAGAAVAEPDVGAAPGYASIASGALARVRAYAGVPLLSTDDRLFGTLCAFAGDPQPASMGEVLKPLALLGRMLSTILTGEQLAADRSQEAATAYAFAERDRLTSLRNRRGWEAALASEEQRARRYGSPASLVVLDLDGLKRINEQAGTIAGDAALASCARVLNETCRPGDTLSRTGGDEFGVLAVECDIVSARALTVRLATGLRAAGLAVSLGCATRRPHEGLEQTWQRAEELMNRNKRRRQQHGATSSGDHH